MGVVRWAHEPSLSRLLMGESKVVWRLPLGWPEMLTLVMLGHLGYTNERTTVPRPQVGLAIEG